MKLKKKGLYDPSNEHDSCGVGFIANINGDRTHSIIEEGIQILCNLEHRGAVGGDQKTGDGAGMLIQIPHAFFSKVTDFSIPAEGKYGVGFLFMPNDEKRFSQAEKMICKTLKAEGGSLLGWRDVPVNPECLGEFARNEMPSLRQIFIDFEGLHGDKLERKLYILRKCLENEANNSGWDIEDFYIPSMSCKTIVYKGMFVAQQFSKFYPDLLDRDIKSALVMVHQRYSTNTFPSWPLAQPFRYIAHNGEINTLRRNINNMTARESSLSSPLFGSDINKIMPIVNQNASDSAVFDNVFELLSIGGRTLEHSAIMMIPEAFGTKYHISEDKRAFYEYHAAIMEPWDGPAALAFTDGVRIGATLDRNGLRPGRYVITKSGKVILASEVGVIDIDPEDVLEKGRIEPGKMFYVDTELKRVIKDNETKARVSRQKPYRRWLEQNKIDLKGLLGVPGSVSLEPEFLLARQIVFGYSMEDLKNIISSMAETAQEPIGSMGNDSAIAVLSEQPQLMYNYFKQLFAQVTNPPIDPYRENLVMSLMSFVGKERNLLDETPEHCKQLKLAHPVLTNDDINRLRNSNFTEFKVSTVSILFTPANGAGSLETAIEYMCSQVEQKIDEGNSFIILSDRGVDNKKAPIPALLALSAVHHYLVKISKRHLAALVLETGEAREVHHFATLISYGCSAINPYIVFETIIDLHNRGYINKDITVLSCIEHYITAVKKGLLKVMSKMGVSTIRSYRGSQIYEAIGLNKKFIDKFFTGTTSNIGGIGIAEIENETISRHRTAFEIQPVNNKCLSSGGNYSYRDKTKNHLFTPEAVIHLQKSVKNSDYDLFKKYTSIINDHGKRLSTLRSLFKFKKTNPVPIEEVEPAASIVKRFVSSAMSFGSLSKEVHETIAIAMNRLGASSNSGEGGEDEKRFITQENGDSAKSKVKQVASGRFGVTSNYLVNCEELQIKMAQGAKPGEGGQLPGHKVNEIIAKVRNSTQGVMLISPPPHHDIYSIEDLAQLIFDLKNANPEARVSVKLVSEVGVGTVAAGVAKGKADMVLISGSDGGTGASPLSSIKHAGSYWEIGLAETQQVLVLNKLRDRIRIQVDGQIKTGRDVVIGALLGAEEFGFGTTTLVSLGCVIMRKCHLNSCPVGIATQNPELRKRFRGKPEHLMNFMMFIANETREYMAKLGFRTFDEMVGRVDLLEMNKAIEHYKTKDLDFSKIFMTPEIPEGGSLKCTGKQQHDFSLSLDPELIKKSKDALENKKPVSIEIDIKNCNRTMGTTLSSEVSKRYGSKGLPEDTIRIKVNGSAGQSFGAFLASGITLELEGDTNDYLGKGLSGGKIILYPPKKSTFRPHRNIISGNVNLFGATGGEAYIHGMAGERFCVRNSGAIAVVEGVGDHGCEYMTGGRVIVLGQTGINFAAGMSGGIAYVLDENQLFDTRCNLEMVDIEQISEINDINFILTYIKKHVNYTGSKHAANILKIWDEIQPLFVRVMPIDYRISLERIKAKELKESELVEMTEEVYR